MEVGEIGVGGGSLGNFKIFFVGVKSECMCAFGWTLYRLYSEYVQWHAGCSAEFALKFNSFREIIGRLIHCHAICFKILVIVRMSG